MHTNTLPGSHRVDAVTQTARARGQHDVRLSFVPPRNTHMLGAMLKQTGIKKICCTVGGGVRVSKGTCFPSIPCLG